MPKIEIDKIIQEDKVVLRGKKDNRVIKVIFPNGIQVGLPTDALKDAAISIPPKAAPTKTNHRLYNENGTLMWDGSEVGSGGGGGGGGGWSDDGTTVRLTTATDNVGIGTDSPSYKLDITGDARILGDDGYNSGGERAKLYLGDGLAGMYAEHGQGLVFSVYKHLGNGGLVDGSGSSMDVMWIAESSGLVGIGTSAPKTVLSVVHDYSTTTFENQLSDGEGGGDILKYGTGTTVAGELYYLHTDGSWIDADADAASTGASQLLGVAMGTSPTSHGMLLKGFARISSTLINGTAQVGYPVFVSTTAGEYTFTAPSGTSDFVRIVGYCLDTHTSDVLLYFNPDSTWIEIS